MKVKKYISLAFLFLTMTLGAQHYYVAGYVVDTKGDTLHGEIKVEKNDTIELYGKVTFRNERGMQRGYKPTKAKAFGYDDQHYVSLKESGEEIFFKVLARGYIDILEIKYEGIRMNQVAIDSEYYFMLPEDEEPRIIKERNFRKELLKLMTDNPEIAMKYPKTKEFDEAAALAAVNEYNAWKAGKPEE